MRGIAILTAAIPLIAAGCALVPEDPFDLRWNPYGALLPRAAEECMGLVRPAHEGERADAVVDRQRAELQACIDSLPESDRTVVLRDAPNGRPAHQLVASSPDGIPVEKLCERDGWVRVELSSRAVGWVEGDLLTLIYLQ